MTEDVKNLKSEVDYLKNMVKFLSYIKQEGKEIMKSINVLKDEIKHINSENNQISQKVSLLEADLEKTIFLLTLKFWEYRFGGKKNVNYEKFEIATKQRKSNI